MQQVVAHLRFLRIAPRKVRLVLGLIRGLRLDVAEQQLLALPKGSSVPILKLLKSAQANAEHNFKLDPKELYIAQTYANEGPKLKRFMPRAMGRAAVILKRMSHVAVVLASTKDMPKSKKFQHQNKSKQTVSPVVKPAATTSAAVKPPKGLAPVAASPKGKKN